MIIMLAPVFFHDQISFTIWFIRSYTEAYKCIISDFFPWMESLKFSVMGSTVSPHEADWQQFCTPLEYQNTRRLLKLMLIYGWDKQSWYFLQLIDSLSGFYQIALAFELLHLFPSPGLDTSALLAHESYLIFKSLHFHPVFLLQRTSHLPFQLLEQIKTLGKSWDNINGKKWFQSWVTWLILILLYLLSHAPIIFFSVLTVWSWQLLPKYQYNGNINWHFWGDILS